MTVHQCPPAGAGVTPCCGQTVMDLPGTDRLAVDPALVTCGRATPSLTDRLRTLSFIACVEAADELERLTAWKAEATQVLNEWTEVWEAAGRPGEWGSSMAAATRVEVERLRGQR